MLLALAAAFLVPVAHAAEPPKTVEILSASGYAPVFSTRFMTAFEGFLRARPEEGAIRDVRTVAVTQNARGYRFRGEASAVSTGTVPALENAEGFLYLSPPEPGLLEAFREAARGDAFLPPTYSRRALLDGRRVSFESPVKAAAQERAALASVFRLDVKGRAVDAVFVLKTRGGLGRLATALAAARRPDRAQIVVSRGDAETGHFKGSLRGRALFEALEALGVRVSAIGLNELRRWPELKEYVKARPDGVKFISANLNLTDGAVPPAVVLDADGLKVGFIGLTRPAHAAAAGRGRLAGASIGDPIAAARAQVRALRPGTDLLIALSNLDANDNRRLRTEVRGLDAVIAHDEDGPVDEERSVAVSDEKRGPFSSCLPVARDSDGLDRLEFTVGPKDEEGLRRVALRQDERPLDDSWADREDLPPPSAEEFEGNDGSVPLIPSAHRLFPEGRAAEAGHPPVLSARDFWTLAASLAADRTRSEVGVLPVAELGAPTPGDFHEAEIRNWLQDDDRLVTFDLDGDALLDLLRSPSPPAVGGVGRRETVHGAKIERMLMYRVAGTERLLEQTDRYPSLSQARNVRPAGDLGDELISALKDASGRNWPAETYASLMEGRPVRETPLWTVNFREISLDFTNTRVVKDEQAFARVSSSRVRGFDEHALGATGRADVDYRFHDFKWTNSAEALYRETEISPPGRPHVIDLTDNRLFYQTLATRAAGTFPLAWLGQSWGPAAGAQYEGQIKRDPPDARRRNLYSLTPGIEIFDGSVVQSFQVSGAFQRDYSYEPAESHYGIYSRAVVQTDVGLPGGTRAKLVGQLWYNYYFRRRNDTSRDLWHEGDASLKLKIPLWREVSLSPFVDFYFFKLKERPLNGYSARTGLSLSFSRLWKPQYEKF